MVWENTKLLLRLFYRPVAAMSGIIDQGHWLYGAIVVAALGMGFQATVSLHIYESYEAVYRKLEKPPVQEPEESTEEAQVTPSESHVESTAASQQVTREQFLQARKLGLNPPTPTFTFDRHPLPLVGKYGWWFVSFEPTSFFGSLIGMAVLYIPCLILLAAMTGSVGSFNVVLRRDYGPLLTCALMAWAAAHLPFTLAGLAFHGARTSLLLWTLSAIYFCLLMALALRMLFGMDYKKGLLLAGVGALSFSIQARLFGVVSPYMLSPFLLYYAFNMFRGDLGDIGFSWRQRQGFRRSMEAATINPRDASAHYQLGLVFQYRRQYTEAIARFEQAVKVDHEETDAHFRLGKIALEQGRLQDALNHFGVVLSQDDKHARSEVWREVGATYLAAFMFAEAKDALATFVERRAYDPEGLYYYGKALEQLGDRHGAHEVFFRCVEAVRTMPHYRQGDRKWQKLARERLSARPA
jgi:tetratricopeptide (TPR) repeat protein